MRGEGPRAAGIDTHDCDPPSGRHATSRLSNCCPRGRGGVAASARGPAKRGSTTRVCDPRSGRHSTFLISGRFQGGRGGVAASARGRRCEVMPTRTDSRAGPALGSGRIPARWAGPLLRLAERPAPRGSTTRVCDPRSGRHSTFLISVASRSRRPFVPPVARGGRACAGARGPTQPQVPCGRVAGNSARNDIPGSPLHRTATPHHAVRRGCSSRAGIMASRFRRRRR